MNEAITERTYPIDDKLLIKTGVASLIGSIVFSIYIIGRIPKSAFDFYIIIFIIIGFGLFSLITTWLWRRYFHYLLGERFITVRQGILSKTKRDFPYGVIQNIHLKQDLLDRLLGIATVVIENASMAGGKQEEAPKFLGMRWGNRRKNQDPGYGISGNRVGIPALTNKNAELLKTAILQKMKDNPLEESHSGL